MKLEKIKQKYLGKTCDTGIPSFLISHIVPEHMSGRKKWLLHFFGNRRDFWSVVLSDNMFMSDDGINWTYNGSEEEEIKVLSQNSEYCYVFIRRLFLNNKNDSLINRIISGETQI